MPPYTGRRTDILKVHREEGGDDWLMTYGDLMSLLLVFFVLLLAISSLDKKKFDVTMSAIQNALGGTVETQIREGLEAERKAEQRFQEMSQQLGQLISKESMQDVLQAKVTERGIVLTGLGHAMFPSGGATLLPAAQRFLLQLALAVKKLPNKIAVEGHTDDVPTRTERFPSNWELSAARAAAVVRFLVEQGGIAPDRLSATGYADTRPQAAPRPENRPKNRRVEIIISREGVIG